ncbi:MAG: HAD-IIIA family hydrolase, partial [Gammaproteobacteria bacterium]
AFDGPTDADLEQHFYEHAWSRPVLFPGVVESLELIRARGLPIGVVTNGREISQSAKIRNSAVSGLVDTCVISESFGVRKPRAAIFEHAAETLGIDPGASWHVGDDPVADVVGASSAGFRTAWLERHLPWPEEHRRCYDLRASQISEVVDELVAA